MMVSLHQHIPAGAAASRAYPRWVGTAAPGLWTWTGPPGASR